MSICAGSYNAGTGSDDSIKDISVLSNMVNLKTLTLSQNKISDITPLQNMTGLTSLDLEGSPIGDISALANLVDLQLWGNKIKNLIERNIRYE